MPIINAARPKTKQGKAEPFGEKNDNNIDAKSKNAASGNKPKIIIPSA
jgi:hypothetical protein